MAAWLAGCASSGGHAPVSEYGSGKEKPAAPVAEAVTTARPVPQKPQHQEQNPPQEQSPRAQTYTVQKGDTLIGIAFSHDLDYHEIVAINNIQNPDLIQVGQELRLSAPAPAATVATKPVAPAENKAATAEGKALTIPVKSQPMTAKLPYSETAVAEIEKMQQTPQPKPETAAPVEAEPGAAPEAAAAGEGAAADDTLEWGMPTEGKLVAEFSENANRKGIDIAGKPGQPVVASAAGKVVYSGSGLRGYGKLVIIKHNNTYLSAYAHNDQILVKEGQTVTRGQKIAEMGNSDSDQVKLHFEIRKLGKPVDPAKFLPLIKS